MGLGQADVACRLVSSLVAALAELAALVPGEMLLAESGAWLRAVSLNAGAAFISVFQINRVACTLKPIQVNFSANYRLTNTITA